MSIAEMCALAQVRRAGYYRLTTPVARDKDIDLRDAIQRIAPEFPTYGRLRMTEELHPARLARGAESGIPHHAGGQSVMPAPAEFRPDHEFESPPAGAPESGERDGVDRHGSALGGRHHVHSIGTEVRLSGRHFGCLLKAGDRMGAGSNSGGRADDRGAPYGTGAAYSGAGPGASF